MLFHALSLDYRRFVGVDRLAVQVTLEVNLIGAYFDMSRITS